MSELTKEELEKGKVLALKLMDKVKRQNEEFELDYERLPPRERAIVDGNIAIYILGEQYVNVVESHLATLDRLEKVEVLPKVESNGCIFCSEDITVVKIDEKTERTRHVVCHNPDCVANRKEQKKKALAKARAELLIFES